MCLSTLYRDRIDPECILAKNIANIRAEKDELVFTDLLEREYRYHAVLVCADLSDAYIVIRTTEEI